MEQNKIRTYLKYAIGEIALVMIGILLALQVNNLNEERKLQKQEQYLLTELKQEFLMNQSKLESGYTKNKNGMLSSLKLINVLSENNPTTINYRQLDSLTYSLIYDFNEFDPSSGVIDDIINSGKLEVIQNDSLRNVLSQWSGQLIDLSQDYEFRNEYFIHHLYPEMAQNFPIVNTLLLLNRDDEISKFISTVSYSKHGYNDEMFNNRNLEGAIAIHVSNQDFILNAINILEEYIRNTIELIEIELKRFN